MLDKNKHLPIRKEMCSRSRNTYVLEHNIHCLFTDDGGLDFTNLEDENGSFFFFLFSFDAGEKHTANYTLGKSQNYTQTLFSICMINLEDFLKSLFS